MSERSSFLAELKRRNVLRAGVLYVGVVWALSQGAAQLLPVFDVPNWVVRAFVIAGIVGFPFWLVFAWFYELTPQGIKRESEIAPDVSITRSTGRKLDFAIIGVLAVAVVLLLTDHFAARPGVADAGVPDKSIAVLPLANTSGDPANEYFSDGLTEEMIALLAKIPDLKLIGRASAFQFKNSNQDSRAIGARLGVAHLLEGSVRKQGERVRIIAELVNAADGRAQWSETYDREIKDVFAVQAEIAAAVAEQMKLKLFGAARAEAPPEQNLAAYNALLQGDFHLRQLAEPSVREAIALYQEAIRLDPRYAHAHARLSIGWRQLAASWLGGAEALQANDEARREAQTALQIAPDFARAHEALGWVRLTADMDLQAAESELQRAATLAPGDAEIIAALAYMHATLGQLTEAEALARKALLFDPLAVQPYFTLGRVLMARGREDEAADFFRKALNLQPQVARAHTYLAQLGVLQGNAAAAREHAAQEPPGFWHDYAAVLSLQVQGDAGAADAALQQFATSYADSAAFQLAILYSVRKEADRMFEWLDRAYAQRDPGLTQLMVNPTLLVYRKDPRFSALCAKLKIPATEH